MLRFGWRLRKTKRSLRRLIRFYNYYRVFNLTGFSNKYIDKVFDNVHLQALPKRQHYFTFSSFKVIKSLNFSAGYILKLLGYKLKYLKRSYLCSATLVLFFRHYYYKLFQNIYIYWFKNITYRQLYYFKKLNNSIKLTIYYLLHKKSYVPRFYPKRRIKRRVLRLLVGV